MLERLKEKVLRANLELVKRGLVIFTWGNVSELDPETGLVVIKPSGVEYEHMKASDMVVLNKSGAVVEGALRPSSDAPTHLELYKAFPDVKGVAHTHSTYATAFAQAGRCIPFYGTTHADYFYGDIPCTRALSMEEVNGEYEKNTGLVIVEAFRTLSPVRIPTALVKSHGVFSFGSDSLDAVYNAAVAENVAKMAILTERLDSGTPRAAEYILDKHYLRKHGNDAYYGQEKKN
ncbi:MAG: L-ribulose-5-phosphate 4-epimerase [Clostridiales bacterium]|jgi:L-ribulose-5-phosphate 4-epimerase|nr:L-ribulose-5-phosphate 4-epimerase [Clostridiales bacterium]